jgi:methionyl-tRNA synthetase
MTAVPAPGAPAPRLRPRVGVTGEEFAMGARPYYITTAIPYVNARPHIGHALLLILADTLARAHRLQGDDVRFLAGTDDNSLSNVLAAEAEGIPVAELVERNAGRFRDLREPLALSFDDFIRTSGNPAHAAGAAKLWRACDRRGDIYRRAYAGLYCVGCERFYAEAELEDGRCPAHRRRPERVAEENYFFRLSRYGDQLAGLIESGRLRIVPHTRRAEALRFIAAGLEDFSISRSQARARGWGIPVPDDPAQVMYVWWDALTNYITALDFGGDGELYRRYWLENERRVHVIGKDLLRFHAVYWPAMLLSAGEPPPTTIYVHEFLTVDGQKIGKSLGNAIDPVGLVERLGSDALRYWLARSISRTEPVDFSAERVIERYNAELANGVGNLVQRTASMIGRYADGRIPPPGPIGPAEIDLHRIADGLPLAVGAALDAFDTRTALQAIWELVTRANRYVEETAPWTLARRAADGDAAAGERLATALYTLADACCLLATQLAPFLPHSAQRIAAQLGGDRGGSSSHGVMARGRNGPAPGSRIPPPRPIFPRKDGPGLVDAP